MNYDEINDLLHSLLEIVLHITLSLISMNLFQKYYHHYYY